MHIPRRQKISDVMALCLHSFFQFQPKIITQTSNLLLFLMDFRSPLVTKPSLSTSIKSNICNKDHLYKIVLYFYLTSEGESYKHEKQCLSCSVLMLHLCVTTSLNSKHPFLCMCQRRPGTRAAIQLMRACGVTACALRVTSEYSFTDLGRTYG